MNKRRKSWKSIAKETFDKADVYHGGTGQYAFFTPCREVHYSLWETIEELRKNTRFVDRGGCGGECNPRTHYVVDLAKVTIDK